MRIVWEIFCGGAHLLVHHGVFCVKLGSLSGPTVPPFLMGMPGFFGPFSYIFFCRFYILSTKNVGTRNTSRIYSTWLISQMIELIDSFVTNSYKSFNLHSTKLPYWQHMDCIVLFKYNINYWINFTYSNLFHNKISFINHFHVITNQDTALVSKAILCLPFSSCQFDRQQLLY